MMSILNVSQIKNTLGKGGIEEWVSNSQRPGAAIPESIGTSTGEVAPQSFANFLKTSISEVNQVQSDANQSIQRLVSGEDQDIHETMLLVEKAELAFKTMGQIRSKVIEAYREVMRMQI
jgi:flagellar hook-basal body complex protein FliE